MTPISLKTTHKHITPDTAITTGFITGHTWIGANKHSKSKHDSSSCRHCCGPPKTTEHIFLECPPLDNHRSILFSNCVKQIGYIPNTTKILFSNKKIWKSVLTFAHSCGQLEIVALNSLKNDVYYFRRYVDDFRELLFDEFKGQAFQEFSSKELLKITLQKWTLVYTITTLNHNTIPAEDCVLSLTTQGSLFELLPLHRLKPPLQNPPHQEALKVENPQPQTFRQNPPLQFLEPLENLELYLLKNQDLMLRHRLQA
ncbi:hypothetical protein LAZ67_22000009 [Cordylochernes scorpioides]|uniref:Reverse transcriptase zinc-binding domain-containing protein n=1 Tax=Cordylochernes scorpioides TaxID=51811 RepID=A0ABY6LMX3_9ARAC|nr:hypothetical protein LAZ67_22000009 [Cordylochernes scorpioides]